jgi:hypothetical protein
MSSRPTAPPNLPPTEIGSPHGSPAPVDPLAAGEATSAAGDEALRVALRRMPPDGSAAALEALQARVLAQWEAQPGARPQWAPSPSIPAAAGGAWPVGGGHAAGSALGATGPWGRRLSGRWWAATALVAVVVGALLWWQQRPDPVLEELMRLDVLSQMAAGEM